MPHTEKRIRHRLLSRRCNTKRRHDAYHVTTYRRFQRNGLLVAVALGRPTAIMVRCRPAVSVTFKRRWVLLLSLMCAVETRGRLFSLHVGSIGAGIEAFFFDTDTEPLLAVSADTEYPVPASVSPYCLLYVYVNGS